MEPTTLNTATPIEDFYRGKSVFITGASGFCGKSLLFKILNNLHGIGTIYVLMRPKNGLTSQQRVDQLLDSLVFKFHPISADQKSKIVTVDGDLRDCEFFINQADKQSLMETVEIVYHIAASTRFNVKFRDQFEENVIGTKNVLEMAKKMKKRPVFVHFSTAYANCHLTEIDEKLYDLTDDIDTLINKIRSVDDETLETMKDELLQGRPIIYTYTKAMAEHIVNKYRGDIKAIILRPAIVTSAIRDPVPGFVDSFNGLSGFSVVSALGIVKVADWDFCHEVHLFPVDSLANATLISAWVTSIQNNDGLKIYNLSSTVIGPADSHTCLVKSERIMRSSPPLYVLRPPRLPPKINRMSDLEYKIKRFYSHTLFAFIIDILLLAFGQRSFMMRAVSKIHRASYLLKSISKLDLTFRCDNYLNLIKSLKGRDQETYNINLSEYGHEGLFAIIWLGTRRYLLKDEDSTIRISRIKYQIQVPLYVMYQITVIYWAWKIFSALPFGYFIFAAFLYMSENLLDIYHFTCMTISMMSNLD